MFPSMISSCVIQYLLTMLVYEFSSLAGDGLDCYCGGVDGVLIGVDGYHQGSLYSSSVRSWTQVR